MQHDGLLCCIQEPAVCPGLKPDKYTQYHVTTLFKSKVRRMTELPLCVLWIYIAAASKRITVQPITLPC